LTYTCHSSMAKVKRPLSDSMKRSTSLEMVGLFIFVAIDFGI